MTNPSEAAELLPCPISVLSPYHGVTNPFGQQAALRSATKFLLSRYERVGCDSSGVSDCVRCTTVYLAKSVQRLMAAAESRADHPPQAEADRDLRWAVYTSAYAVLRDYDNHPSKDRGLIAAGDVRIPNLIADGVVSHMARLGQQAAPASDTTAGEKN